MVWQTTSLLCLLFRGPQLLWEWHYISTMLTCVNVRVYTLWDQSMRAQLVASWRHHDHVWLIHRDHVHIMFAGQLHRWRICRSLLLLILRLQVVLILVVCSTAICMIAIDLVHISVRAARAVMCAMQAVATVQRHALPLQQGWWPVVVRCRILVYCMSLCVHSSHGLKVVPVLCSNTSC